jgi:hypothetical protein
MATCCSYSEEKEDSEATLESPSCYKPVHKCASLTRTLVLVLEHFLILAWYIVKNGVILVQITMACDCECCMSNYMQ